MDGTFPLGRITQWMRKALMLQRKTSLKHLIQGLSTSGFVQPSIGSTFVICQLSTIWQLKFLIKLHCVQALHYSQVTFIWCFSIRHGIIYLWKNLT